MLIEHTSNLAYILTNLIGGEASQLHNIAYKSDAASYSKTFIQSSLISIDTSKSTFFI